MNVGVIDLKPIFKYHNYFESWLNIPIEQFEKSSGINIYSNIQRQTKPEGWMTFLPVCGFKMENAIFISCIHKWEDEIRLLLDSSAVSDAAKKMEQFSEGKTALAFFEHALFGLGELNLNIDTNDVVPLDYSHLDAYVDFYKKVNQNLCAIIDPYEWISEGFMEMVDSKTHFCMFENDDMVSVTTSDSLPNNPFGIIQLGIDTVKESRGRGYAEKSCAAFVNYYLKRDLLPVWKCYLDNTASVKLAKKLGFHHLGNEFFISSATEI